MLKWLLGAGGLMVVLALLLVQLSSAGEAPQLSASPGDFGPTVSKDATDPRASAQPGEVTQQTGPGAQRPATQPSAQSELDPRSEEFSARIDVAIPNEFRARLARCDRQGVDPDAKITLRYRLLISDHIVSASQVQIDSSNLGDSQLERCMVNAVQGARWQAADMPDFQEELDLFIRIRSLNKYLEHDEQKQAKAGDHERAEDESAGDESAGDERAGDEPDEDERAGDEPDEDEPVE